MTLTKSLHLNLFYLREDRVEPLPMEVPSPYILMVRDTYIRMVLVDYLVSSTTTTHLDVLYLRLSEVRPYSVTI